jgi:cation diffusion facilitator family transporter
MSTGGSSRAIVAAFLANVGIALSKFIGFLVTGSSSMLAESIHSVADSGNQALLALGQKRSAREADEKHQFGHGRERYFWAFVVALVLFTLGSVFSIFEGIRKFQHPEALESAGWAIGILFVAIVLESLSIRTAISESNPLRGEQGWAAFIRHSRNPELPVLLLEDFGALIGLALALAGVGLTIVTGNPRWDAVGTICIGSLLGVIAAVLATEMKSLLIGEGATDEDQTKIVEAIESAPAVLGVIYVRTQHMGPDDLLVGVKADLDHSLSVAGIADAINDVEARIRAAVPIATTIFIEPDITRPQPAS